MGEEIGAHVRFQLGARHMAQILHIIIGCRVHDAQRQVNQRQLQHPVHRDGPVIRHRLIGDGTNDQRENHLAQGGEQGAGQVENHFLFIFGVIGHKPLHQRGGLHAFVGIVILSLLAYSRRAGRAFSSSPAISPRSSR